jgi:hypothetical protein
MPLTRLVVLSFAAEAAASVRGDDKRASEAFCRVAKAWARLGQLRRARQAAERCSVSGDQLDGYTAVLRGTVKNRTPPATVGAPASSP